MCRMGMGGCIDERGGGGKGRSALRETWRCLQVCGSDGIIDGARIIGLDVVMGENRLLGIWRCSREHQGSS